MRTFVVYSLLRAVILAVTFGVLWLVLRGVWSTLAILLVALVVSAIISIFALRRQRDALAGRIADRSGKVDSHIRGDSAERS